MELYIFILWIAASVLLGIWSNSKGHGFASGLLTSLFLSPMLGLIVVLAQKPNVKEVEKSKMTAGGMKKCPFCAELIKTEAKVCRFYGRDLPGAEQT